MNKLPLHYGVYLHYKGKDVEDEIALPVSLLCLSFSCWHFCMWSFGVLSLQAFQGVLGFSWSQAREVLAIYRYFDL